jgi:catechol 2,3-dioxygenase-like lactoylglutathione lyase family enzyme
MLKIEGVTHWSIGVKNLEESEEFYRDFLGLEYKGRLGPPGNQRMACVSVGNHDILLCETSKVPGPDGNMPVHHSFTVSPEEFVKGAHLLLEQGVPVAGIIYRRDGYFNGRELYFSDPSGNRLELRDPTWRPGMPEPTFEEITA